MNFATFADIVILVGAFVGAILTIYNFFFKAGKGIKGKVDQAKQEGEDELQKKIDARIKALVPPMLEQQASTLTSSFGTLLDKHLPNRLTAHDHETRQKYLSDRQRYLCEIKDEVINAMGDKIASVETHDQQMNVFTVVLQELLRERIMEIYRRNKHLRCLEEHERFELDQAYRSYKSINGNSYIDGYYKTMGDWDTVPDVKPE